MSVNNGECRVQKYYLFFTRASARVYFYGVCAFFLKKSQKYLVM